MRGYRHTLIVHVRRAKRSVEDGTQRLRLKLLAELEAMFDLAEKNAKEAGSPKQRQLFMRIMAYIAQVINSMSKAFDEAAVTQDLKELERMIDEAMAKRKDKEVEATSPGAPGS